MALAENLPVWDVDFLLGKTSGKDGVHPQSAETAPDMEVAVILDLMLLLQGKASAPASAARAFCNFWG